MRSWTSVIKNRWLYEYRLPWLPEQSMIENNLEVFDKRFRKWKSCSTLDLSNYSNFDKEAYKYTFSRPIDWHGPVNYYRNLPLSKYSIASRNSEEQEKKIKKLSTDVLFVVGNRDSELSLELVSKSAKYVERFVLDNG